MAYYIAEIRINKSASKDSKKKQKNRRQLLRTLTTLALISLLISVPTILFSTTVTAQHEPELPSLLNDLGFTNIELTTAETFAPGIYNITLYAEIAGYHDGNELSYYAVNTTDFQIIFTGPEGGTYGITVPPLSKIFETDSQFGLSMITPESHRYFTEYERNDDFPEVHAQVYVNLDNPEMFLIGFENFFGGGDRDYNDMVFSLVPIHPPEIINVTRTPEIPNYNESVAIAAEVIKGDADIESVILSYQIGSASWINITMSLDAGFYVADIPAQPYNTTVNYMISAIDADGFSDVSTLFSYTVGDFVPPVISDVIQVPSLPYPAESVSVSANVTEPPEASGVKNVTLHYTFDSVWQSTAMTNGGLWTATIPGQGEGVEVEFFIQAFDNAGNSINSSTSGYTVIIPNRPPVASFITWPPTVHTGTTVDFDASASYDTDGSIVSYLWDFGDGNTATGITVSHAYTTKSVYTVTLTVTDDDGATDTTHDTITVMNSPPSALFVYSPAITYTGVTVDFDGSISYDFDGLIVSYHWNFGDGTTASGAIVSHSYVDDGEYSVTLTVVDNEGASDSKTAIQVVKNRPPIAKITESSTILGKGETVTYNASLSYDLDGTIVSYEWDFGDGTTATGVTADHAYAQDGTYVVTLTVTDDDGATDTVVVTKIVTNQSPVAIFTATTETASPNEPIGFNAADSYDPDGTIVSYMWDFGDGNTESGVTTIHAYAQDGMYLVTLTVTDDDGATDSAHVVVVVTNMQPVADFTATPETAETGASVSFDASASYDPDGTIVSYLWDFGDGTTATGVTADHVYPDKGVYIVTLTVTDNDGATDIAHTTVVIVNRGPVAEFTVTPETDETGESITFDASASYDPDGTIANYLWDFGDGTKGTGVSTQHTYSKAGTYTVTLTVTDNYGAKDSANTTIVIVNRGPVAEFTVTPETAETGASVSFDASASYDPDGTIVSYMWDFGDGTTGTGVTADHTYSEAGNYTVTLTVTDDVGISATTSSDLEITGTDENGGTVDSVLSLAILSVIVLAVTALTATLLYALFIKRRKKTKNKEDI